MKKLFFLLFLTLVLLTGCAQEENATINDNSKDEKIVNDFLTNNTLDDNPTYKNNRFYVFTEDGKYAHYYGSRIVFSSDDNIYISVGKYNYSDSVLTLNQEFIYNQKYDKDNNTFNIEKKDIKQVYTYNNFELVTKERTKENIVYVSGNGIRLEKKNDNVPKELVNQIKEYLKNDFSDFDFNKLKGLEEYEK